MRYSALLNFSNSALSSPILAAVHRRVPERALIDPLEPGAKAAEMDRDPAFRGAEAGRELELAAGMAAEVANPLHGHSETRLFHS